MSFITLVIVIVVIVLVYRMMNQSVRGNGKTTDNQPRKGRKKGVGVLVGGGLGWAFGGPIGALLGAAFGSMFEGLNSEKYAYTSTSDSRQQRTGSGDFSVSLLVLAALVMKADGKVMQSELNYVRNYLSRKFGDDATKEHIRVLGEILKQPIPVQDVCMQIRQYMQYEDRLQLLHFLLGISNADGVLDEKELNTIELISGYLGLSRFDFLSIKAMFVKEANGAYKIMEIEPDASDEEVKKAYRKMAVKYHPDKVSHLGEDVQRAAKEKFQNMQQAYDEIKKSRGFN